jgi:hypothetical protein
MLARFDRRPRWEPKTRRTDDERFRDARYFGNAESPIDWLVQTVSREIGASENDAPKLHDASRLNASALLASARRQRQSFLGDAHRDQSLFGHPHRAHWRTALDRNEHFVEMSAVMLAQVYARLGDHGQLNDDLAAVLTRLTGRAVRIARDIHWLLVGGFPEAALARWRTLHEVG